MADKITKFRGQYYFLSNFFMSPVRHEGIQYTNAEAAFQAAKLENKEERREFARLDPSKAKRKGHHVKLRPDWEKVKTSIMHEIVYCKFTQNPDLAEKLLATGDAELEEGNDWNDRIWGVCNGKGENHLGKILMRVRDEIRKQEA